MSTGNSNFEAARAFVEFGLQEQSAGRRESASGPGSSRAAAAPTLALLQRLLRQYEITSVLDLGCGDWNWMQDLRLPQAGTDRQIRYLGWDASPELVDSLNSHHGQPGLIDFEVKDITTEPLPEVDLVIARDVLFHLPISQAEAVVTQVRRRARYFLSTAYLGELENQDIAGYLPIEGWGFHRINLNVAPFDLLEDLQEALREPLCSHKGQPRFVCLYAFDRDHSSAE